MTRPGEPYAQGDLDALCSVYAVINAFSALCPEMDSDMAQDLFRKLVRALATIVDDPLTAVLSGVNASGVRTLVTRAIEYIRDTIEIEVVTADLDLTSRNPSKAELWDALTNELSDANCVAVIGLHGAHEHWTVAYAGTKKVLRLLDGGDHQVLLRSRCTLKLSRYRCRLKPREIVILRRVDAVW